MEAVLVTVLEDSLEDDMEDYKNDLKGNFKVRVPPKRYHGRGAVTQLN